MTREAKSIFSRPDEASLLVPLVAAVALAEVFARPHLKLLEEAGTTKMTARGLDVKTNVLPSLQLKPRKAATNWDHHWLDFRAVV